MNKVSFDAAAGHGKSETLSVDPVARAKALAPLIEKEAVALEAKGTLTQPVIDALAAAKLFWVLLPKDLGGEEASVGTLMEVIEALSYADASTGWSFMATSISTAFAAGFCGEPAIDLLFRGSERAIMAGMLAPGRNAKISANEDGTYRVSGKYSFGSGSGYASWIGAGAVLQRDGTPLLKATGEPELRTVFMPREKVVFQDNWDTVGLSGTGSYDYEVPEQNVAPEFVVSLASTPKRCQDVLKLGSLSAARAGHAGVVLGLVKRSLQEIARIATEKARANQPRPTAEDPVFQHEYSIAEATYQAMRAYVFNVFTEMQDKVVDAPSNLDIARMNQATSWLHYTAPSIINFCHKWAFSATIRRNSIIGRCTRDLYVATQHLIADPRTLVDAAPEIIRDWNSNRV